MADVGAMVKKVDTIEEGREGELIYFHLCSESVT